MVFLLIKPDRLFKICRVCSGINFRPEFPNYKFKIGKKISGEFVTILNLLFQDIIFFNFIQNQKQRIRNERN